MLLYIGPGIGAATIIIVVIILLIVLASLGFVLLRPIKRFFAKLNNRSNDQ